MHKYIIRR